MTEEKLNEIKRVKDGLDKYNGLISQMEYCEKYHYMHIHVHIHEFIEILKIHGTQITREMIKKVLGVMIADAIVIRDDLKDQFDNI